MRKIDPYEPPTGVWADVDGYRSDPGLMSRVLEWFGGWSSDAERAEQAKSWGAQYLVALMSEQLLQGPGRTFVTLEEAARIMGVTVGHLRNEYLENLPAEAVLEPVKEVVYRWGFEMSDVEVAEVEDEGGAVDPDDDWLLLLEEDEQPAGWGDDLLSGPKFDRLRDRSLPVYVVGGSFTHARPEESEDDGFRSVSAETVRTGRGYDPELEPKSRRHEVVLPRLYNLDVLLARQAVKLDAKKKARHTSRGANGRFV